MAVISDFRTWKIPNRLILAGLIIGIFISIFQKGIVTGLRCSVTGCMLPIIFLICLYFLRIIGGGDIKLFSMAGSFIGTDIIYIIVYSFIFGGVLSVFYILKLFYFKAIHHSRYSETTTDLTESFNRKNRIHFSLAIFTGTIYYFLFR